MHKDGRLGMVGSVFGRLTVVRENGRTPYGELLWDCVCSCGNIATVRGKNMRRGITSSCGCLAKETTPSKTHGMRNSAEYRTWMGMKARCTNPNNKSFIHYGARGIIICDRWLERFENFYEDMGPRPKGMSLDRRDNNGNYEPSNCRWATPLQQTLNRSIALPVDIPAIAISLGITYGAAYQRWKRGQL